MLASLGGVLFLLISFVATIFAWQSVGLTMFVIPGLALTALSLTFLLSTKARFLEVIFHGIENMYFYHKVLGTLTLVWLLLHYFAMRGGGTFAGALGLASLGMFFSVILVAFFGRKLKYEVWRYIHRLVYLAYLLGLTHAYLLGPAQLFGFNLLSLVVNGFAIVGVVSGFYIMFVYQEVGFSYKGRIKSVKQINHDTVELEIELNKSFDYEYGQFSFLKIMQPGFEKAPHPFSISGGSGKTIFFTAKASGDHTKQMYQDLKAGSLVKVDRAYGHMKLTEGRQTQVWIAGGIGVTPFLSFIRENTKTDKNIDFFYAYTGEENTVHVDMINDYASKNPNVKVHLVDSNVSGFLNFDDYELSSDTTVFMCGPVKMMDHFASVFKAKNSDVELVYEGFTFR